MEKVYVIVIPAEGDSDDTERWYLKALRRHYDYINQGRQLMSTSYYHPHDPNIVRGTFAQIIRFADEYDFVDAEIHAQGGFGAYVACKMYDLFPNRIKRIFFIGGAPCEAMTWIAKFFHRHLVRAWYRSPISFFADDPPHSDPEWNAIIGQIRASSTEWMCQNPLSYRNQLLCIGRWSKDEISPLHGLEAYFVPNGATLRPKLWDNTYDNARAAAIWAELGVTATPLPQDYFSFYSLMPATSLFDVMDKMRVL